MGEGDSDRSDFTPRDDTKSLQNDRDCKFCVLPGARCRNASKIGFNCKTLWRSCQFETYGFVDDPEIARKKRQRFTYVFPARRDIKKGTDIAWIGLFGEVESEGAIVHRLCGVFKELGLRRCRKAMLNVRGSREFVFRKANRMKQRCRRDIVLLQERYGLPCGESCR